jgi:hypothetical protein
LGKKGAEELSRQSDAKTRSILNKLLIALVLASVLAGFGLRMLDSEDPILKPVPQPEVAPSDEFVPIPDPIPDPIPIP